MAMLQEVRHVFETQIEKYLRRLEGHSSRVQSPDEPSQPRVDDQQLSAVKRLATDMTEGIIKRLRENEALWQSAVDERPGHEAAVGDGAEQMSSAASKSAVRCRELEIRLKKTLDEERRLRQALKARLQGACDKNLAALDEELEKTRNDAISQAAPHMGQHADDEKDAQLQEDFVQYAQRVRENLENAQELASGLDSKMEELDGFEQFQQQHPRGSHIEQLLASRDDAEETRLSAADNTEENKMMDLIRQQEQVAKRMRLHRAG
eukprot:TRINITY_DN26813_c0_g1_i1.p1 TRINITY_DN26813_c0_g1~~TRINITY_DN26813_c0_g1_i1.p1  ORF type:complete len:264 (-),score=73.65 TRINITY_DN26813_c0_g1_i1:298-1089(-)